MRPRSSAPFLNLWRRLPRVTAGSIAALAALSPGRALVALAMTLGCGTSAFVAVASVGGSVHEAAGPTSLGHRPAPAVSRDAWRPEATEAPGLAPAPSASAPSTTPAERPRPSKTPGAASGPSGAARSSSSEPQAPESMSAGPSSSPSLSDGDASGAAVDTTPPETVLAEWFPDGDDAVFSFRANEPASFTCSLDGTTYTTCDSPRDFSELHPGWHIFTVRATDDAGNTDPSPAEVRWHADRGSEGDRERH